MTYRAAGEQICAPCDRTEPDFVVWLDIDELAVELVEPADMIVEPANVIVKRGGVGSGEMHTLTLGRARETGFATGRCG